MHATAMKTTAMKTTAMMNSTAMTGTIVIDPVMGVHGARPPRASARTYQRRRAVVGGVLAVFIACGAVLTHDVLAGSGGVPASAAASQPALVRSTVTAQPGDTLWSIAQANRGDVAAHRYVDKLVALNGGASIQAGQQVVLP